MYRARGDHLQDRFRAINPRAQLPTLDDHGTLVRDSQAILVYLARKHGQETWFPNDPIVMTRVVQWLLLANEEIRALVWARVAVLEQRLREHQWVAADHGTIADIACFPYAGLAPQGEVPLDDYPAVRCWIDRIKVLPNYVPMPGLMQGV